MVEVVAALIWDKDKFLICQRPANKARALLWEFVGGKVEKGETKEQALIRECKEELNITLNVGDILMEVVHEYPDITVHLTLFNATIAEGVLQKLEHNDIKWIIPTEIPNYNFCPADEEILEKIKNMSQHQINKEKQNRDNFTPSVKRKAAQRVAYRCSFLGCGVSTIGPKHGDVSGVISVGQACHICAAAPNGPRYDETMSEKERKSIENCIWMCDTHAKLIDADEQKYPVSLLREWKNNAEKAAAENIANYKFSKEQLEDENSLAIIFDGLIKEGNFDALRMIMDKTSKGNSNEILLRYEVIYNAYCNRDALLLSINYYLQNANTKKCDDILRMLVANNIFIGIGELLPFCDNEEIKILATEIINNNINKYLFREKNEVEIGNPPTFKDNETISKLLSNIIITNKLPALPTMANGEKFMLYEKEFAYEMLAHAWMLFSGMLQQKNKKNDELMKEHYLFIKKAIPKIIKLDKAIQENIWCYTLNYVLADESEFNYIYSMCPISIKETGQCKQIETLFELMHNKIDADKALDDEELKRDERKLVQILLSASKEKKFSYLEDNKFLLKKNVHFLYVWTMSCDLGEEDISKNILSYKAYFENDFLWNCLAAYYNCMGNPPTNLSWIIEHKQNLGYPEIELFIKVLRKYKQWDELNKLVEAVIPLDIKYQIILALIENTSIENIENCIKLFDKLEQSEFRREGFYYNFSSLYYQMNDVVRAKACLEKEYDAYQKEESLLELLKLRYKTSDFKLDKYVESAKHTANAEILFLVAIFYEKKQDLNQQRVYLLKALFIEPQNENILRGLASWFLQNEKSSSIEIGKIYKLKNDSRELNVALIEDNLIEGIAIKEVIGCTIVSCKANGFIGWNFYDKDDVVEFNGEKFRIIHIASFIQELSQFVIGKLMTSKDVTTIKGSTTEEALEQIKQLMNKQEREQKRVLSIFNESRGVLPITMLARQLGCGYEATWNTIISTNELKINNSSTCELNQRNYIMAQDAIGTLMSLNAIEDLSDIVFTLPEQVKIAFLSKITERINDVQSKNTVGKLYTRDNQLYKFEHDKEYKKGAAVFLSKAKEFLEKTDSVNCSIYQSTNSDFKAFFIDNNLINESYTLGLAKSNNNYALVTDEPFMCIICDMEKIPRISFIDLLLNQNLPCDKLLSYMEQLSNYNFLNFFNAERYKRIVDLALKEDEIKAKELLLRFEKWLIPEDSSKEHQQRVFNVYRELGIKDRDSSYFNSLSEIGRFYFAKLFPEKHQEIIERIKNMKFKVEVKPSDNNFTVQVDVFEGEDIKEE